LNEELLDCDAWHQDSPSESDRRELVTANEVIGEGSGDAEKFGGFCDTQHRPAGAM
jgi:hypothetical protein